MSTPQSQEGEQSTSQREEQSIETSTDQSHPSHDSVVDSERFVPALSWDEPFDVLDYFPVQPSYAIQHSIPYLCVAISAWSIVLLRTSIPGLAPYGFYLRGCAAILSMGAAFSLLYHELYRLSMVYRIEEFRILTARGAFFRVINSSPLSPYYNWDMRQAFLDRLFGVWRIQLFGDFVRDDSIHCIPSLTRDDAMTLFSMLTRETDRQMSVAGGALEFEKHLELMLSPASENHAHDEHELNE